MCATGEGYHVPDLPTSGGHTTLPLRAFPLPLPASGLLLPWLLAEPVGRRPHRGRAADSRGPAGLGLRAPGLSPRYSAPSSSCSQECLGAASPTHPGSSSLPEHLCNGPGCKHRPASLSWGWGSPYFYRPLRVSPSLIGKGRKLAPRFGGT